MADKPAKKFRIGNVTVVIWKNDGVERSFFTVDVQRSYKDEDGEWKNTTSLNHADCIIAAHLLVKANGWIMDNQ